MQWCIKHFLEQCTNIKLTSVNWTLQRVFDDPIVIPQIFKIKLNC